MATQRGATARPKDQWLDHWLIAQADPLKALVSTTIQRATETERRARRRSARAQEDFERVIAALVVNLAYLVIRPSRTGCLALIQDDGHRVTRYEHPSLTVSTIRKALVALAGSVLSVQKGRAGARLTTTISPTDGFVDQVRSLGVSPGDFDRDPDEEVIILSITYRGLVSTKDGPEYVKYRSQVNYRTTDPCVDQYRERVRCINDFLRSADLTFVDDGLMPVVRTEDRTMRRRFSTLNSLDTRWDLNGRVFGGFWQNLQRDRRQHLRINGEPVCDLDFKNAFARLAYLHTGQETPDGDLYDMTGILPGYERDHPTHRDGVKAGFNALLNGGAADVPEILSDLPEGTTAKALRHALAVKHPGLVDAFGTNLGLSLMFTESTILMNALERLMAQGIVALGMHDGCMVAESHQEAAQRAMEAASVDVLGVRLMVVSKAVCEAPRATERPMASRAQAAIVNS